MAEYVVFPETYRGFQIGAVNYGLNGWRARWRSSLEGKWIEGHLLEDKYQDCRQLAKDCVDFMYKEEALEVELGRKPTMEEIMKIPRNITGGQ